MQNLHIFDWSIVLNRQFVNLLDNPLFRLEQIPKISSQSALLRRGNMTTNKHDTRKGIYASGEVRMCCHCFDNWSIISVWHFLYIIVIQDYGLRAKQEDYTATRMMGDYALC